MNVGINAESNGVTIEAVQTIGDANNLYILLDITLPEDKTIHPSMGFDTFNLRLEDATSFGYSYKMIDNDNEDTNKVNILVYMDSREKINNGKLIILEFKDLIHYANGERVTYIEGEWNLKWKLNYKDISTKYFTEEKLVVDGETVNIDLITISPIAINVQISGSYIEKQASRPPAVGARDLIEIKAIELKDGTVLTQENASMFGISTSGTKTVINMLIKN